MLHPVPDSTQRARLLEVVELQRQLMAVLFRLRSKSTVDLPWLQNVWPGLDTDWVRRFWENDNGKRATWVGVIAAAEKSDKRTVQGLLTEQLQFAGLYHNPPTVRLTKQSWKRNPFAAVNKLLVSFYAPLFYEREGYLNPDGTWFHKGVFIDTRPLICPYTDDYINAVKLDHFLPKDQFPMLACHPDNLIPCSTDSNDGGHKGTKIPLDLEQRHQAESWFHPRWASAKDKFRVIFPPDSGPQPKVAFVALNARDQPRLDNMERLFKLGEFWGETLDDEVQGVASDVQGLLREESALATEDSVKCRLLRLSNQERRRIGRNGLAIAKSFYFEHIANTPSLLAQVVRTCTNGT